MTQMPRIFLLLKNKIVVNYIVYVVWVPIYFSFTAQYNSEMQENVENVNRITLFVII